MWVRRVRCYACGGPKVTPSRTAFDHCSWCGTFTDWNHQVAYETRGSAQPGPQYDTLKLFLTPQLEAARRQRDRAALEAAHRRLYAQHVADCPAAYSPRAQEPEYRAAIMAYHAACDAAQALDDECGRLEQEMIRVSRTLFWVDGPEGRTVRGDRFFAVYERFEPFQSRVDQVVADCGALAAHPDSPPASLLHKIARSRFLQAWMPVLDRATGERALALTGLASEYEELELPALDRRACGRCGSVAEVPRGASRPLCESCGSFLHVLHDVPCSGCGAVLTPTSDASVLACPYCRSQLQVMRPR